MEIEAIVEVLRWANGQGLPVRVVLDDDRELRGVPTSVDLHITAHEVFLRPEHHDETEIAVSLGDIALAELI
ncbi:MAG: hypothetical protein SFU84_02535 [Gemmatimonadales bacterium]|nr:hypothetical protein [Gemmatimonadales bacterium]